MSDEEFLTKIKLNYLLLKIELYPLQAFSWCQSACSGTLLEDNTTNIRTACCNPSGSRIGKGALEWPEEKQFLKYSFFFFSFEVQKVLGEEFSLRGGGSLGSCGGHGGLLRGSPRSFSPGFNRQPGFIVAKFCEQPVDLRALGAHPAPAAELRGRRAGGPRQGRNRSPSLGCRAEIQHKQGKND